MHRRVLAVGPGELVELELMMPQARMALTTAFTPPLPSVMVLLPTLYVRTLTGVEAQRRRGERST